MTVNYTLAKNTADIWADNATQNVNYRTLRDKRSTPGPQAFDVGTCSDVSAPTICRSAGIGSSRIQNRVLDAIVGGWTFGGNPHGVIRQTVPAVERPLDVQQPSTRASISTE